MSTNRRDFIKGIGATALGIGLFPTDYLYGSMLNQKGISGLARTSPESQGVSSSAILNFIKATSTSNIDWHSFMLLRHGKVIAEGWWQPFAAEYKHTLYSLSKSFTSTAIGLLVKEGKLSVEDSVLSLFADEAPSSPDENLKQMKVKHLLTMNTGHGEDTMPKLREQEKQQTWTKTFLSQPVAFQPGTHFLYNTGATYMLGAIVHKKTGQTLTQYLEPRLFQPLGIKNYDWEVSPQGLNTAGYGLRVKTEDIALLGQLYLQKGKWNGKEILTESWVDDATKAQTTSQAGDGDWSQGYGYQFWRCKPGFYRGDGAFGQYCFVMPQYDAVLAVTSESWDMQKSMNVVYEHLLPGIKDGKLNEDATTLTELKKELGSLKLSVPTGNVQSPSAAKWNKKVIQLEKNEYGATQLQFDFTKDACSLTIKTANGPQTIKFGWQNWFVNKDSVPYIFSVAGRNPVPSKIAGTATWINDTTLQLNLRFVEAIHGDKLTCVFDGGNISVALLNSVAENAKNSPEKRVGLMGKVS
ncbi:serine hydrolase [Cytophagaceae bacterium DM2B3-1]|uniref:Serine hydrolase n=1 Tax=Xanthocytophaga flava TaxID=3048013 RepID=A0ABT7CQG5_9BACT|nr:serine hydrolase [Xanthocytophaga flavus]MDJ1495200.1 serine hydrolase [Xanthocytophaga flavus]